MRILKGTKLKVNDKRKGTFFAVASNDFDTEKDEWYDIVLDQDYLEGLSNDWVRGEQVPARNGISQLTII